MLEDIVNRFNNTNEIGAIYLFTTFDMRFIISKNKNETLEYKNGFISFKYEVDDGVIVMPISSVSYISIL